MVATGQVSVDIKAAPPTRYTTTVALAPTAAGAYTYTVSGVRLAANTTYQIRITNVNPSGGNGGSGVPVKLRATASTNEAPVT